MRLRVFLSTTFPGGFMWVYDSIIDRLLCGKIVKLVVVLDLLYLATICRKVDDSASHIWTQITYKDNLVWVEAIVRLFASYR